jgi:hypothetical protein
MALGIEDRSHRHGRLLKTAFLRAFSEREFCSREFASTVGRHFRFGADRGCSKFFAVRSFALRHPMMNGITPSRNQSRHLT